MERGCPTRRSYAWGGCLMPTGLKRYYGRGHLHFLTFSCYRRLALLKTIRARNLFVHALGEIRERYKFLLVGYVVMPDHVHLRIIEPAKGTPSVVYGEASAARHRGNCASHLQESMPNCRASGRRDSMISTCIARRKEGKSSTTCMPTRSSADW